MKAIQPTRVVLDIGARLFARRNWGALRRSAFQRRPRGKAADDAQLKLYGQILPGGFLNYGYSEDPDLPPEQLSLEAIQQAQVRYGERLLEQLPAGAVQVLDAGCGMGGLTGQLLRRGCQPTALTPNRTQLAHMRQTYPAVPLIEGRLENIPRAENQARFDAVITSESFQYVKLDRGLEAIGAVLRPGGRWILSDYFRCAPGTRGSGHVWDDFQAALVRHGWRITYTQDITANVLPTIAYVHMWGRRLALPLATYAVERLERKRPLVHHLLQDLLGNLRATLLEHLQMVDPATFAREKKYLLLVLERQPSQQ